MQLNPLASWFLVIGYLVMALTATALLLFIKVALSKLNAKLEELQGKMDPLLAKADELLTVTNEKVASLGDKAEGILAQGEETAESVHHKVDKTATAVQRTIHAPIIGINSIAAGVSRGVETFGRLQRSTPVSTVPDVAQDEIQTGNGQETTAVLPALTREERNDGG